MDQTSQITGIASKTQIFQKTAIFVFLASYTSQMSNESRHAERLERHTSAHSAALYVFRMLPKRIIYMQPNSRLIRAHMREKSAEYLGTGSAETSSICRIVKIALSQCEGWSEGIVIYT